MIHNFRTREHRILLLKFPIVYSVDTHDNNCYGYMVDTKHGDLLDDRNIVGQPSVFIKYVEKKHRAKKDSMVILFEAGALGFSLYRKLTKLGYTCKMIAPSSIPGKGKKQKTDRQDAMDNLGYYVGGNLRFVNVPAEQDEQVREMLRYRGELNYQVTKQKQRILGFVKRLGCEFSETKTTWTRAHYRWLRSVQMADLPRQLLDIELENLAYYEGQIGKLEQMLDACFKANERYQKQASVYQCLSGIGRIGAMTMVLEGGDLSRFSHPNAMMNFFGMIPKLESSGTSNPAMHITKAGNTHMRLALVTAARAYRDPRLLRRKKQIENLPQPLQDFINRMQERLYHRYRDLKQKGKHGNKVKCAVARELCGFLWELSTKVLPQIDQSLPLYAKAA